MQSLLREKLDYKWDGGEMEGGEERNLETRCNRVVSKSETDVGINRS